MKIHNSTLSYDSGGKQVFCPINCAKLAASNGYLELLKWLMEKFIFMVSFPNNSNLETNEDHVSIFKLIADKAH